MAKIEDLIGKRFGSLVVIRFLGVENHYSQWLCKCDCGKQKIVKRGQHLTNGQVTSCGCAATRIQRRIRHGHARGRSHTGTYVAWLHMKERCLNPQNKDYKNYGGRGIAVCDRWLNSFENFLADMGEKPRGFTIERIENNGNYEPGNCKWIPRREQNKNKRSVKYYILDGKEYNLTELSEKLGIAFTTLQRWLGEYELSVEQCIERKKLLKGKGTRIDLTR